jgi:hypothetical protein
MNLKCAGLISLAVLACSVQAAEIVTKDGNIVLIVDSSSQMVSIATRAEYANDQITTMHQAVTMVGCSLVYNIV